jgi:hypothetical protein
MARDSYDVDIEGEYPGLKLRQIASDELDKVSVRTVNEWQRNMDEAGYRNTGDTINSITWEAPAELERVIGSDRIAALIGEFGRPPGAGHPPPDDIADWVHEQSGLPDRNDDDFDSTVFLIGRAIDRRGLPAQRFARDAVEEVAPSLVDGIEQRLNEDLER